MAVCTFCDARNAPDRTRCEKCGAELPVDPQAAQRRAAQPHLSGLEAAVAEVFERDGLLAAVKHYREATGQGLKESKSAVEAIARSAGLSTPQGTGCRTATAALLAAAFGLAAAIWLVAVIR